MVDYGGKQINKNMKIKGLILVLFIFVGLSCDISKPIIIDGQREYVILSQCGSIKIQGSSFSTLVIIGARFNGKYHINRDLLKMETISDKDTIVNMRFQLNDKDLFERKLETKNGEAITVTFTLKSTEPYRKANDTILLLPSNFIMCEGKPVITDTLKLRLGDRR